MAGGSAPVSALRDASAPHGRPVDLSPGDNALFALFDRVSNKGRWGDDDELGTLNYITPAKRVAAAHLVKKGEVLSLARPISAVADDGNPNPPEHFMLAVPRTMASPSARDYFGGRPHGLSFTHLDAVAHTNLLGRLYNDREADWAYAEDGLRWGSTYAARHGIFTRGVLLDVARSRGLPYLEQTDSVTIAQLEAAEKAQGVRIQSGDVLLLRVGYLAWQKASGRKGSAERAGIVPEVIEWIHRREVAVFGGDCIEKLPWPSQIFDLPLHRIALPSMGLSLLDFPDVEPLATVCAKSGRWDFLFTAAPIARPGLTGSFINPTAVF